MKVLYISHHRENSGWGEAARNYLLALDSVGVDVVARAVDVGNPKPDLPPRIVELQEKDIRGCDIVIQHVLPKFMDYDGNLYNIGLYVTENDLLYTEWPAKLNMMDELWVPNHQMKENHEDCFVTTETHVIPHCFDPKRFDRIYPKMELNTGGDYMFYTIADFNRRKHLSALIRAFHTEFTPNEPVSLVIKTSRRGMTPKECQDAMIENVDKIKSQLKLYNKVENYKQELLICGTLTDEDIMKLHSACDCFVSTSFNEAWNLGAFEAALMGNDVLATDCDGHRMFLNDYQLVDSQIVPTFGMADTFEDMGTSREKWYDIDLHELMQKMRISYEEGRNSTFEPEDVEDLRYQFSYETVGNLMKDRLEKCLNVN